MLIAKDSNSPIGVDHHTPSKPIIIGSASTGTTKKTTVLQNDNIADVLPSFNAVNNDDEYTLIPTNKQRIAKILNPCTAISRTD